MDQAAKAKHFTALHVRGAPVLLYNAWDVGSARAIAAAGAAAIATSSWAVAVSQGYSDGEDAPLALVHATAGRIVAATELPVTVDFEGGYSEDEAGLASNVAALLAVGIVGINFEDRVVAGQGLYSVGRQASRIAAIRGAAAAARVPLFINARTDLFLGRGTADPKDSLDAAIERGRAYAAAGASGFFVPGLVDEGLIGAICDAVELPVNVMMMGAAPPVQTLAGLGVSRVSWGSKAYGAAMEGVEHAARAVFG